MEIRKKVFVSLFVLLLSVLFLIGCSTKVPQTDGLDSVVDGSMDELDEVKDVKDASSGETNSLDGWVCISSTHRIFRDLQGELSQKEECTHGCSDGQCIVPEVKICDLGFKCKNSNTKGMQLEGCEWVSETKCEYGCENAKCLPKPNETETTSNTDNDISGGSSGGSSDESITTSFTIDVGEKHIVLDQNFSIYNIESGKAIMQLGQERTEWIDEGANYSIRDTIIKINAVYFQPYLGGRRAVNYVIYTDE
jgi:hypothetical protein